MYLILNMDLIIKKHRFSWWWIFKNTSGFFFFAETNAISRVKIMKLIA